MDTFRTRDGLVRGRRPVPDVVAVLGIPYAAAPFGANRFHGPRPAQPWTGVRDCGSFGPISPQSACLPGAPSWSPGDEDVLTVNVWTPAAPDDSLPVLVWIHGGAYTFGSSAQPDFDGTALARAGLVVVTFNYRVGFEGFGSLPADGETPYPENRGLLDQVAALRWVRENIAAFGGDPGNVTVAGQSSGAGSIACLMVMDRARGLFRRAIAHSVVSPCYSVELAAETTRRVAAAAGIPATAAALASASPQALVAASDKVVDDYRQDPDSGARHYDPVIYGPVADGDVLPTDPLTGIAAGAARGVDLLVCHTTREFWLLDAVGSSKKITTDDQLARFAKDFGLPDDLVPGYRELMPDAPVLDIYLTIYGDMLFGEYSSRLADTHAQAGGRAFMSRFARQRTGPQGEVHAWHCADIPFAFGTITAPSVEFLIGGPPSTSDHHLSQSMVAAWAAFATSGDPGWQPLGTSTAPAHIWATEDSSAPAQSFTEGRRELWRTHTYPLLRP
ncbi:carboxylesterase/lipase family protein [Streptomyces sp. XD-27]|uniref:carboxylesterase/lipase family protein n=1 Tax=Streptomyces sp. XD-27 TaxID=3062779 RepID=UPI0026F4565B|nr:carboxylesterase family protein [Streptomyces sp. XD-27]WKX71323.1 carboxylesterase family protein [Streptomyces sp. XD-27]